MDAIAQGALVPRDDLETAWQHLTGSCEQKDWWAEPSQLWPNPPLSGTTTSMTTDCAPERWRGTGLPALRNGGAMWSRVLSPPKWGS
jgi:hypothetical protein